MNNHLNKRGSELESLLHSEHNVKIEKMAVGGLGVGRIEYKDKKIVVFIPYATPEDVLKIKISRAEKNFLIGEIIEITEPSSFRQEAPCEYFGRCGGCLWQHLTYEAQIAQKELILKDLFKKFLPEIEFKLEPTITANEQLGYRNRIQLKQLGNQLGYFEHESHNIVDIDQCLIAEKALNAALKEYRSSLKPTTELKKIEIRLNQNEAVEIKKIGQKSEGVAFSQVNRFINSKLIKTVSAIVKHQQPNKILELYAGSGNFTFPLAQSDSVEQITAVEWDSDLTKLAVEKIKTDKLHKKITFFTAKCENFCNSMNNNDYDLVFLDPPRAGCHQDVINKAVELFPDFVLYIACNPVSLVRDIQPFMKDYSISHLQIFDMFPQTDHFETLCFLKKRDSSLTQSL